jgi:serine/threonine protein kinase
VRRVEISNLRLGGVLGSGGQGQVVAVENYLIDDKWPAALKTYNGTIKFDRSALEKIVTFPGQLHENDRDWLMGISSWPWAIAMDNGTARGFLMRVVPSVYNFSFTTVTQGIKARLSTVEYLLNSDDYVRRAGISISEKDRLNLLGTLAQAMSRLHALGVVIGDLSPKNLLFNLNSYSSCFLIDCDAIALRDESALDQVDTPEWEVPTGEKKGTAASDSYKFGLLAIRLFARDQSSQDVSAISALSPELGSLARLSQDRNPLNRPGPGSWFDAIQSAASAASTANANQAFSAQPKREVGQAYQPNGGYGSTQRPYRSTPGTQSPVPQSARKPGSRAKALAISAVGLLVLAAVLIGVNVSHSGSTGNFSATTTSGGASPNSGVPSSQAVPSAQPTNVGIVAIGDSISGGSAATAIAGIFNTYFSGINSKNYQQALSVFDPSGVIDPNSSSQVQQFADGVSTTTDSAVTLVNIGPSGGSVAQSAEVQFTSNQQAGYGPQDDPSATCTNWDVTYVLSQDSSGNYLISSISNSSDSAC